MYNSESCDSLVNHTIKFSNVLNRGILVQIENLSTFLSILNAKVKPIKIPNLTSINEHIEECVNEFKINQDELSSCRNYCSYYRLNQDLPIYEGYPELFINIIV